MTPVRLLTSQLPGIRYLASCKHARPAEQVYDSAPLPFYLQESVGDLMIRNIQLNHSGKYLCTVKTALETFSAAAEVIVRGEHKCAQR